MPLNVKSDIDIEKYLNDKKSLIDLKIKQLFEEEIFKDTSILWDAIKYSLLNGGKRIRGTLCIATYESISKKYNLNEDYFQDCLITAISIELIHAMSLIHDDLPSMDNDDFRRGKPTLHKKYNEAIAILSGDAMLSMAFYLISKKTKTIQERKKIDVINILSSTFTFGLVPGQILDLSSYVNPTSNDIEKIHKYKTAELIKSSVLCGAIISLPDRKENEKTLETLTDFGLKIGIAFQIIDDILDITSNSKTLGKTAGKDAKQNKTNYPQLFGVEKSKDIAKKLIDEAKIELDKLSIDCTYLSLISDYIIQRIH